MSETTMTTEGQTMLNAIITTTYTDDTILGPFETEAEARAAVDAWIDEHEPQTGECVSFHLEPTDDD